MMLEVCREKKIAMKLFLSIPTHVTTVPQRHRQMDKQRDGWTDELP